MSKIVKYIGVGVCLLIALAQLKPILLISEFILSQNGTGPAYLMGKLAGHIFVAVVTLFIAAKVCIDINK